MRLLVKISRFNQNKNPLPVLQEYGIQVSNGMTVLEVLLHLKETQDGTLGFRCSCRSAICGSCAMEINGFEKLACKTQVMDEFSVHGCLIVKPLKHMKVIKDLVVDMTPFWDDIRSVDPWLVKGRGSGQFTPGMNVDEMFNGSDNCIKCGACVSACTTKEVSSGFTGPAALAKSYRFLADPRDGIASQRLARVDGENGIWDCARCYFCQEVCPKDVKPIEAITRSRKKAIESGLDSTMGAKHITEFAKSVYKEGLVNETTLPMKIMGFDPGQILSKLPLGLKMLVRGKMMMPLKKPIKGIKEIRKIFANIGRG